jgi:thiosulfate reductase cytochrome b subunit
MRAQRAAVLVLAPVSARSTPRRHAAFVRVTHWLTALAFAALLVSGVEVLLSHPRFYWGETGNVLETPLFTLPVPASRSSVPTGYGYVLPDQNGWSRYLHFQSAWLLALTGFAYLAGGLGTGHFRSNLIPPAAQWRLSGLRHAIGQHLRSPAAAIADPRSYNLLQRIAYLVVIFVLVPAVIWTGLAMSPGFTAIWPATVALAGGKQSARTLHFAISIALTLFVVVHVAMLVLAGFTARVKAMITGDAEVRS